jgi:anti-sigma B factor antagonist
MEFHYDQIENDVLILAADGGLNSQTSEQFVSQIEKLVDAGLTRLIVDCGQLNYISSSGMGVLLRLHRRLKKHGGNVKICSLHGIVPQALEMMRLNEFFDIYPDLDQARLAFRS